MARGVRGLLLDTHVALWLLDDNERLGNAARRAITSAPDLCVSAASSWEMAIKASLGKLTLPPDVDEALAAAGLRDLPITRAHMLGADLTALPHRDPFDALIAAQSAAEGLDLVTADAKILAAVDAIDARR